MGRKKKRMGASLASVVEPIEQAVSHLCVRESWTEKGRDVLVATHRQEEGLGGKDPIEPAVSTCESKDRDEGLDVFVFVFVFMCRGDGGFRVRRQQGRWGRAVRTRGGDRVRQGDGSLRETAVSSCAATAHRDGVCA